MTHDTIAILAQMRRDKRREWATFALKCWAPVAFLAVLWWVTNR